MKRKALIVLFPIVLLSVTLAIVFFIYDDFPSSTELGILLDQIQKEQQSQARYVKVQELLIKIRNPQDKKQDAMVEQVVLKLQVLYEKTEDIGILEAVDDVQINGGFANMICGFYARILKTNGALDKYRGKPTPSIFCP